MTNRNFILFDIFLMNVDSHTLLLVYKFPSIARNAMKIYQKGFPEVRSIRRRAKAASEGGAEDLQVKSIDGAGEG